MAGKNVVAKAWVQIIPEIDGIQGEIDKELGGVDAAAGKAGKSSGKSFSSGFSGALGKQIGRASCRERV